jgi:hypothetical protein
LGVEDLMTKQVAAAVGAVLVAMIASPHAAAKGPLEATVEGPGLDAPIVFEAWGESGPTEEGRFPLMPLVETSNFFSAAFGSYNATPIERPKGDLGPRYTVTYDLGGPEGDPSLIVQHMYPHAKPIAVTYMAPGQPFYGSRETVGGWFAAPTAPARPLKDILVEAGMPREPPTDGERSPFPWTIVGTLAAVIVVLAGGALTIIVVRRRPHPAV